MAIPNNTINDSTTYSDLRWDVLLHTEESGVISWKPYIDSNKDNPQVTIGVGFNIEGNKQLRDLVLEKMGFELDPDATQSGFDEQYIARIDGILRQSWVHGQEATLQAALNQVMQDRYNENQCFAPGYQHSIALQTFELPHDVQWAKNTFNLVNDATMATDRFNGFESKLDGWLGGVQLGESKERVALLSLLYNNVLQPGSNGIDRESPSLQAAVKSGNRIRAWFEIRYASNVTKDSGLAKRRAYESALFGLYDHRPMDEQAQDIIEFLESDDPYGVYPSIIDRMIAYELTGTGSHQFNAWINSDTVGSYDITDPAIIQQISFQTVFLPIATQLAKHYGSADFDLTNPVDIEKWLEYQKVLDTITITNQVVLGLETDGVIKATNFEKNGDGSDLLIAVYEDQTLKGGSGNDIVIGATGNDTLEGGADNDVLIGNAGADNLAGSSGSDTLFGGTGNDHLFGGSDIDTYIWKNGDGNDVITEEGALNILTINNVSVANIPLSASGIPNTCFITDDPSGVTKMAWDKSGSSGTLYITITQRGLNDAGEPEITSSVITIKDFHNRDFGIVFADEITLPIPPNVFEVNDGSLHNADGTLPEQTVHFLPTDPYDNRVAYADADVLLDAPLLYGAEAYYGSEYYTAKDKTDGVYTPILRSYVFDGGNKNDTLIGGNWQDKQQTVAANANHINSTVYSSRDAEGNIHFVGDVLNGKDGDDKIYANAEIVSGAMQPEDDSNILIGGRGSDILVGGSGADILYANSTSSNKLISTDMSNGTMPVYSIVENDAPILGDFQNTNDKDVLDGGAGDDDYNYGGDCFLWAA